MSHNLPPFGEAVLSVGVALLLVGMFLALLRMVRGPSLPDRVVAFEVITMITMGLVVTYAMLTDQWVFLDVAIVLALITFIATVALADYMVRTARGRHRP